MKGMVEKRTRIVMAALLASLMVVGIALALSVRPAQAAANNLTDSSYAVATDIVTPKIGTATTYKYYTTVNASAKVPAANQWIRTDGGAVDISGIPGATTLYFANSTSPVLDDIKSVTIPASPVIATATYAPKEAIEIVSGTTTEAQMKAALDKMFVFKTKVKVVTVTTPKDKEGNELTAKAKTKTAMEAVVVPNANIQVKFGELDSWGPLYTKLLDGVASGKANGKEGALTKLQRVGGTIYVRIAAAASTKWVLSSDGRNVTLRDNTTAVRVDCPQSTENTKQTVLKTLDEDSARTLVRAGVSKAVKIARKANGPAMAIDYANHAVTVKKGQEWAKTTEATEPASWTKVEANGKIYFGDNGNVAADSVYAYRTAAVENKTPASLTTFVDVPKDVALATTTTATISGGYETAATMKLTNIAAAQAVASAADAAALKQAQAAAKNIAYQYAVVDISADDFNGLLGVKTFDYTNTKVKWTTVKTGADGTVSVNLAWKAVAGKQVLVRKAAAGTTYSSQVEIFNAPKVKGGGTVSKATEVGCWTKLAQADYTADGFTTGKNTNVKFCPYVEVTYTGDKKFDIYVYGAGAVQNTDKKNTVTTTEMTAMIGKKAYDVTWTAAALGGAKDKAGYLDVKYTGVTITDLPAAAANKVVFTFNEGFVVSATAPNLTNTKIATTLTVDTKAPTILSATTTKKTETSGELTIVFDSKIAISGTETDASGTFAKANVTFLKSDGKTAIGVTFSADGTYTYNARNGRTTVVIPYTVAANTTETGVLTVKNVADVAGNALSPATKEMSNPAYSN